MDLNKKYVPSKTDVSKVSQNPVVSNKKGFGEKVMNVVDKLNVPLYAAVGALETITGKGDKRGLIRNVKDNVKNRAGFAPLLRKYGMTEKIAGDVGMLADMVLDPLNYVGVGLVGKGAKLLKYGAKGAEEVSKLGTIGRFLEKAALKDTAKAVEKITKKTSRLGALATTDRKLAKTVTKAQKGFEGIKKYVPETIDVAGAGTKETLGKVAKGLEEAQTSLRNKIEDLDVIQVPEGLKKYAKAAKDWLVYNPGGLKVKETHALRLEEQKIQSALDSIRIKAKDIVQQMNDFKAAGSKVPRSLEKEINTLAKDFSKKKSHLNKVKGLIQGETEDTFWQRFMKGELLKADQENLINNNPDYFKVSFTPVEKKIGTMKNLLSEPVDAFLDLKKNGKKALENYKQTGFKQVIKNASPEEIAMSKAANFIPDIQGGVGKLDDVVDTGLKTTNLGEKIMSTPAGRKTLEIINNIGKGYAKVLGAWKSGKVLFNPGAYPVNYLTNVTFLAWHDPAALVDPKFWSAFKEANKILRYGAEHPDYKKFEAVFGLDDLASGLNARGIETVTSRGDDLLVNADKTLVEDTYNKIKKAYGSIDVSFKMANVLYRTDKKFTRNATKLGRLARGQNLMMGENAFEHAVKESNEIFMNYAAMPKLVKVLRDSPIGAPFVSFQYAMLNKLGKTLLENPGRLTIPVDIQRGLAEMNPATEKEKAEIAKRRPYLQSPRYGKLPDLFSSKDPVSGKITKRYFDYKKFIPQYGLAPFKEDEEKAKVPFLFENPLVSIPLSIKKNEDFIGKPIVKPGASRKEKNKAIRRYIREELLPTFAPGGRFQRTFKEEGEKKYGNRIKKLINIFAPYQELFYWNEKENPTKDTNDTNE